LFVSRAVEDDRPYTYRTRAFLEYSAVARSISATK
jgi:hypothetical protein